MIGRYKGILPMMIIAGLMTLPMASYGKKKPKIFHPEMESVAGDWEAPHRMVGEKPKTTWSEETMGAAVNRKPLEGKIVTRVGEIIDVSCYLQLGKHGKGHVGCAKSCIMNGHAMGLLDADGNVYLLFPEEHDSRRDAKTELRNALIHYVAEIVKVTGTFTNVKGQKAIYVHGFIKKE